MYLNDMRKMDTGHISHNRRPVSELALMLMHAVTTCRQGFEVKAQTLEEEHVVASGMVDRTKVNIEAKQRAEDDIRKDVELAKLGAENAMVERVSIPTCFLSLLDDVVVLFPFWLILLGLWFALLTHLGSLLTCHWVCKGYVTLSTITSSHCVNVGLQYLSTGWLDDLSCRSYATMA